MRRCGISVGGAYVSTVEITRPAAFGQEEHGGEPMVAVALVAVAVAVVAVAGAMVAGVGRGCVLTSRRSSPAGPTLPSTCESLRRKACADERGGKG